MEERNLVDSKELAQFLGVTRRTLKRYTADGLVRPVKRHQFRYRWDLREAVQALHEQGKCQDVKLPD